MSTQDYIDPDIQSWSHAARIYYDIKSYIILNINAYYYYYSRGSIVKCEQIRAIAKSRLSRKWGSLSEKDLAKVDTAVNNSIKSKTMNETVIIPKYLTSRLKQISQRLELNEKDTLEALFDWAEVSLSLAEVLEIDELKPNVLYDQVEKFKAESIPKQDHQQLQGQTAAVENVENISFDAQSINNLCSSVKILAEALTQQKVMPKYPSRNSSKTQPN
ncbi:MAG: hypothetical protein RLZZ499_2158 [Cyanobacteriota bacterium]